MRNGILLTTAALGALTAALVLGGDAGRVARVEAAGPPPDANALFNRFCVQCHGRGGDGHGPARPYVWPSPRDFTSGAFQYKSTPAGQPPSDADLARTIRLGVDGTSMPGFSQTLDDADIRALVGKVKSLAPAAFEARTAGVGAPDQPPGNSAVNSTVIPEAAIAIDRSQRPTQAGYWVANGLDDEAGLFGRAIKLQGPPPDEFAPAQATQSARQCARCHNQQFSNWGRTVHAGAGSPGLLAQLLRLEDAGHGASVESCQRCHAPLAEQHVLVRAAQGGATDSATEYVDNPAFNAELRDQGLNCAACHMRGWRRFGPPNPSESLLRMPNYPVRETDQLYTYLEIYERSDFCMPCHQLPPRQAVNGKPLMNTYKEWLEGPYMRRGIQCQHCHMPNREHTWKGVHDPDTFRQGIHVEAIAARSKQSGAVSVRARVTNIGAGHYLPTTPTPAAWLTVELVDEARGAIEGARSERRIGRKVTYKDGTWTEVEDTRIAPGDSFELAKAWRGGATDRATHVRIVVRVHPDDYYEGLYAQRLARTLTAEQRRLFEQALEQARGSHYVAVDRLVRIK